MRRRASGRVAAQRESPRTVVPRAAGVSLAPQACPPRRRRAVSRAATLLCVARAMAKRGSGTEPRGSTVQPSVRTPAMTHVGVTGTVPIGE